VRADDLRDIFLFDGPSADQVGRRIVERHKGQITIDTQPGQTVLRVQLPVRQTKGQ